MPEGNISTREDIIETYFLIISCKISTVTVVKVRSVVHFIWFDEYIFEYTYDFYIFLPGFISS